MQAECRSTYLDSTPIPLLPLLLPFYHPQRRDIGLRGQGRDRYGRISRMIASASWVRDDGWESYLGIEGEGVDKKV
jgi:hypothetical protein